MHRKSLLLLWGGLFGLCAVLGFDPEPQGVLRTVYTAASIFHFIPPAMLLWQAKQHKHFADIGLIRNLSGLSLVLTLVLLIANFLSIGAGKALGDLLYYMLIVISSPMICSGYWALSLFLWACLLIASLRLLKKDSPSSRR